MKTLIVGLGEIGNALYKVLKEKYPTCGVDTRVNIAKEFEGNIEIMHICIPYSEKFIDIINQYKLDYNPLYVVIHSTVPVGTTEKVGNAFHSPIRGKHPDIERGLYSYTKYLGYDLNQTNNACKISSYFSHAGLDMKLINGTRTTELMKLLELCRYGVYIAFAKEQERICDHFGVDYYTVVSGYEKTRNEGIVKCGMPELQQPILYPFKDYVRGHCTVEDMEILLSQKETPIIREAYNIDKGTTIWGNTNIYPSAKIGKGCSIGQFCEIGEDVIIGNNVRIGAFTFIPKGVVIEDKVFISPKVTFSNDKHPPSKKECWGKILVKQNAIIGMGAIILPGVTIGENAVIGAGAVVTRDVPSGEVWYGIAAYSHGRRNDSIH